MSRKDGKAQMYRVVDQPVYSEVEPVVAEAVRPVRRAVWPWVLGALGLAGLATAALAWPHNVPVAEPTPVPMVQVQTPDVGEIMVGTPSPTPTAAPITLTCDGHTIQMTVANDGESVYAFLDNSVRVTADIAESASGARYEYAATGLPWGGFGSDWNLELWNKGADWSVFVNDTALDCGAASATVTVTG